MVPFPRSQPYPWGLEWGWGWAPARECPSSWSGLERVKWEGIPAKVRDWSQKPVRVRFVPKNKAALTCRGQLYYSATETLKWEITRLIFSLAFNTCWIATFWPKSHFQLRHHLRVRLKVRKRWSSARPLTWAISGLRWHKQSLWISIVRPFSRERGHLCRHVFASGYHWFLPRAIRSSQAPVHHLHCRNKLYAPFGWDDRARGPHYDTGPWYGSTFLIICPIWCFMAWLLPSNACWPANESTPIRIRWIYHEHSIK